MELSKYNEQISISNSLNVTTINRRHYENRKPTSPHQRRSKTRGI